MAEAPDPLQLRSHGLAFKQLDELRLSLDRMLEDAERSLTYYYEPVSGGFAHKVEPGDRPAPNHFSRASTATCLAFLDAFGTLDAGPWAEKRAQLRNAIIDERWVSAELPPNNPFTASFLLEAVVFLGGTRRLTPTRRATVRRRIATLNRQLKDQDGGLRIDKYPPTAFLTHKAVRALVRWKRLDDEARKPAERWIWNHLYEESVLVASASAEGDVFELAYAVLTATLLRDLDEMTPEQRGLLRYALDQFFESQGDDGAWPRSRPLFLYPKIGYAYCYDYELLVQLLSQERLARFVLPRLDKLALAARALGDKRYPLPGRQGYGWSSGHHPKRTFAESWSTASVFHYCFELQRFVSEAIRGTVFDYVGAGAHYKEPGADGEPKAALAQDFLDSPVERGPRRTRLKRVITTRFLQPLVADRERADKGKAFDRKTPVSAIFYGPPGTSKTELAHQIAAALSWPLLAIDPSHLTRRGLDKVHAEAHELFTMLQSCDQVVVLLDEFDELVREREGAGEMESRFLTTAMLPKLAALSGRRRLVYLLATNHLEQFDAAIQRHGRFDMIVPVMPPTTAEKLREWPQLATALDLLGAELTENDANKMLADLTYLETRELAEGHHDQLTEAAFVASLRRAHEAATMTLELSEGDKSETWPARMRDQQSKIRIPGAAGGF